jgi:hypothetical protein
MTKRFCARCQSIVPEKGLHACVKPKAAPSPAAPAASSNIAPSSNKRKAESSNRNARWRAAHPEQWRRIMRGYMRPKRADEALARNNLMTPRLDAPDPQSVAPRKY